MTRRSSRPSKKKTPPRTKVSWRRWALRALLGLALLAVAGGAGVLTWGYVHYSRGLPDFHSLEDYRPPEVSRLYSTDGTQLAEFFLERRTFVRREQIPDQLIQAVLAAEDADFYQHQGLDYLGMLRALYNSLRAGRITGSGSTITQQTVKTFLLTPERSFARKAREIILSRRLESRLEKDEILTLYLNQIYFGHGRYGVQEAARHYFYVDVSELTLAQAAMLAGVIQSPERISPLKHPKRARRRRAYVLRQMVDKKFVTAAAAAAALEAPLVPARRPPTVNQAEIGWFVDAARRALIDTFGEVRVREGGLQVKTTLDLARQRAGLRALLGGLAAIDRRHPYLRPKAHVPPKERSRWLRARAQVLGGNPPKPGRVVPGLLIEITPEHLEVGLGVGRARLRRSELGRHLRAPKMPPKPAGQGAEPELPWRVGDVLLVRVRRDGPQHPKPMRAALAMAPQAALVDVDPFTRQVRALVGGESHDAYPFDRASMARRQPGSTFKPVVFGAALESRRYTPATLMLDAPETWHLRRDQFWQPRNYSKRYLGEVPLRTALAKSINTVAVKLTHDLGVAKVQDFARRLGITSPLANNLTLGLGSSEVTPLELANAYSTLGAGGARAEVRLFTEVRSTRDGPIESALTEPLLVEHTLDPAVVWLLRSLMRSVVTSGSGRRLADLPRPVVGKTGTTNKARDAWFVGLLPDAAVVAWVGFDDRRSLGRKETGGRAAAPIVKAYLEATAAEGPDWPPPPKGIVTVRIDRRTGLLAPEQAPPKTTLEEHFLAGTEPSQVALAAGELDAGNFFLEEAGAGDLPGPPLAVPTIGIAPMPPKLLPAPPDAGATDDAGAFEVHDEEDLPE